MNKYLALLLLIVFCFGCEEEVSTPKPRSYPKVEYPKKTYQPFDTSFCAFTFQYPSYTLIEKNKASLTEDETLLSECWFDVFYPVFDGRIHFTYYPLKGSGKNLEELKNEAFQMADWHNKRANYIDELLIDNNNGVSGVAFDIDGPAASPFQFFLTDSTDHFLRGALYFNTQAKADSLAPITDFVVGDILKIIETFEWKE